MQAMDGRIVHCSIMPISCHFQYCKALPVASLTNIKSSIAALKQHQQSISAIHMPGSIEYSQAASTVTSVGNGIGPGTSA